jgi:hypothetical protein
VVAGEKEMVAQVFLKKGAEALETLVPGKSDWSWRRKRHG